MDLVSVSAGITNPYTSYFNNSAKNYNTFEQQKNSFTTENKSATSNIILVKKGSTGYMTDVDFDEDGTITLEELNKYCEENGVSEKDKITLMTTMEFAKVKDKLIDKNVTENIQTKETKQEKNNEENDSTYAKKGDEKYNEVMDKNKDGVVTYTEYVSYISENSQEKDTKQSTKTENTYSKNKNDNANNKEAISTVEYEV